ncbi:hypothetical protein M409DRAFT_29546 [Zasmidium cellare ATCC 36951]|uniref:Uncharacterized protein n=1 Tax=Zasmidium cellare ATCC 36951 TaxID=1080233 RepID=A0A6A6C3G6_ZASCE|nr:uncharacterized protein M409DRAFT_29546 [Zasmidium cellare ATCC 36951]KAF2159936.1 hypothetical protein M409DRAFT_29546 [Zasmidium cellare ATCC 36951]
MKNKNVSQYWEGSSSGTAPGLPQDMQQDPVRALQYPNRVSHPPATSQATMNQQLQALSLAPSSSSPRPQALAPIVSSWYSHPPPAPAPAPAPAPPTFSFSLPIRGRDPEASVRGCPRNVAEDESLAWIGMEMEREQGRSEVEKWRRS